MCNAVKVSRSVYAVNPQSFLTGILETGIIPLNFSPHCIYLFECDAQLALLAYVQTMAGLESGLTEQQAKAADINGDKTVSVEDAQLILIYYVSNTISGQNVTWDELLGK